MGIQTMEVQGDIGSDTQRSQILSLSRQGSLYNLTLNEVQNQIGEPLYSMNLDDLLKNISAGEAIPSSGGDHDNSFDQYASSSGLHRQGSISVPRELSKKTVDEVWRDIQQEQKKVDEVKKLGHERQSTLGEMTLEDFLVKAGVVADGLVKDGNDLIVNVETMGNINPMVGMQDLRRGASWLQQFQQMQGPQSMMGTYIPSRAQPIVAGAGAMFEGVFPEAQLNISSTTVGAYSDSQTAGRKRGASDDISDKLADRRQKRMIKNRESAARSRARKQAYTNELENKVSRLEEENERLNKQKEMDKIVFSVPLPEPRYQLRRTSSAPLPFN